MSYKKSKYIIYSPIINEDEDCLVYSTKMGKLLLMNKFIKKILINNEISKLGLTELNQLANNNLLVPKNENEFEEIINKFINSQATFNDKLSITVAPSAYCQFDCDYCGQKHLKFNMKKFTAELIVKKVIDKLKQYKYKELYIIWFGAEPLMGLDSIKYISNELLEYVTKNNIVFTSSIITNGLLLKYKVFEELIKLKIFHYQITIDGNEKVHDKRRYLKNNNGKTFSIIYNNLLEICKKGNFDPSKTLIDLRCNVDIRNYISIYELMDKIKNDGIHNKIFFNLAPINSWENDAYKFSLEQKKFSELEMEILNNMIKEGFLINPVQLLPKPKYITCMATNGRENELIDAFGNIFNCIELPYNTRLHSLKLGNINSSYYIGNTIDLPYNNWYYLIKNDEKYTECKECVMLPICGGGCPKHWVDGKDKPCPSYKFNFPQKLYMFYSIYLKNRNNLIHKNKC